MYPNNKKQLRALKAAAKALNIKFEISPYDPGFVKMIEQSRKEIEEGKFTVLDPTKSLWEQLQSDESPEKKDKNPVTRSGLP